MDNEIRQLERSDPGNPRLRIQRFRLGELLDFEVGDIVLVDEHSGPWFCYHQKPYKGVIRNKGLNTLFLTCLEGCEIPEHLAFPTNETITLVEPHL